MMISREVDVFEVAARKLSISLRFMWNSRHMWRMSAVLLSLLFAGRAVGQGGSLVLERDGRVISLVPYAPNILRVTMSTDRAAAISAPGYGIVAQPLTDGWTHERDSDGGDVFRSARMTVRVAPGNLPKDKLPKPMPMDRLNYQLRAQYFGGMVEEVRPHNDALLVTTPDGGMLLHMRTWTMAPESTKIAAVHADDKGYRVGAAFDSPADEHYCGLGQQQKGWMDLRDHEIRCWHDYNALGGQDVCVPFMVSSRGYGLVCDNPSKTTIDLGFNGQNLWSSQIGNRVSYFVIAGKTSDEIYEGYPELFVRWFEWGTFQPVMRVHGERKHTEVWAYGRQAEPILAKYLKLRYQLLPYTYSIAYQSYKTGAPYMRALFMDFPRDLKTANIPDEYMYGPAFLVAPVTEQGATHRKVYLPAGCDWYNYWTNARIHGGQTIEADAPIDTLPLFVRAGSIVPIGSEVQNAKQPQTIVSVRVYRGANGRSTIFQDDGKTYAYEKTGGSITRLFWNDAAHRLKHEGVSAWTEPDQSVVTPIGR